MSITHRSRTLKAASTWDRDTAPQTKTKTRRFKEESRPDGPHPPSTATSSRLTLPVSVCGYAKCFFLRYRSLTIIIIIIYYIKL